MIKGVAPDCWVCQPLLLHVPAVGDHDHKDHHHKKKHHYHKKHHYKCYYKCYKKKVRLGYAAIRINYSIIIGRSKQ